MGIIKTIRLGRALSRRDISIQKLDTLLDAQLAGYTTYSGVDINETIALNLSAVFNAVWIISNTVASLPLILYRRVDESNKKRNQRHNLYDLLHNQPNPEMTSYVWREISQTHLLLWGNSYSQIIRGGDNRVLALWPLNPDKMRVERENGRLIYKFKAGENKEIIYPPESILHIPGLGFDGRVGKSVVSLARQSIGLGLATEEYGSRFFGNGANSNIVLKHPGRFDEKSGAADRMRKQWSEKYSGLANAHKPFILEEGMDIERLSIPPEDAQFLQTRKFQIDEIARWFNLPPHKLKDLERATFSNIEEMAIEFVQDSIRPWLIRWEQHLNWKLLNESERRRLFFEFLLDALLRGIRLQE
jgi:HK97 family phage portal protein